LGKDWERDFGGGIIEMTRKFSEVCAKFVILDELEAFGFPQRFTSENERKFLLDEWIFSSGRKQFI
jgi:hypothetical protein